MRFLIIYALILLLFISMSNMLTAQSDYARDQEPAQENNPQSGIIEKAEALIKKETELLSPEVLLYQYVDADTTENIIFEILAENSINGKITLVQAFSQGSLKYDENRIPPLLISDKAYVIRDRILSCCATNKDPVLIPYAQNAIYDDDYYIRARAVWYLAKMGAVESLQEIERGIANESGWCALRFAQSAMLLGSANAKTFLKNKSLNVENSKIQAYALSMLLEAGDYSAIDPLVKLCGNFDDRASAISYEAIAKYLPQEKTDILARALAKGDTVSSCIILDRLSAFEEPEKIIKKALPDSDKRKAALLKGIITDADKSEESFLNAVKSDYTIEMTAASLKLSAAINHQNGLSLARKLIEKKHNRAITVQCLEIICKYGNEQDLLLLSPFLEQEDTGIALCAADAVLSINKKSTGL